MKILFWIINYPNSFGEVTNSCLLAQELRTNNFDIQFYASNLLVKDYLNYFCFDIVEFNDIDKNSYDLIVFSEYYTLFNKNADNQDLSLIDYIKSKFFNKIPLLTLDTLGLGAKFETINSNIEKNPSLNKIYNEIEVPKKGMFFSIKPCPMNHPEQKQTNDFSFYWRLPILNNFRHKEKEIKNLFNLNNNKRIFIPISKWKYFQWEKHYENAEDFVNSLNTLFISIFSKLDMKEELSIFLGIPSKDFKVFKNDNINFYFFNPNSEYYLEPPLFEQFLSETYLIITLLLIQNSFIRAVNSGIHGINITHNVYKKKDIIFKENSIFSKISINNFYFTGVYPLNNENPFVKTFRTFELFDKNLINYIEFLLKSKQKNPYYYPFYKSLKNCDEISKVLQNIV